MLKRYHIALTENALEGRLSSKALRVIVRANIGQDSLPGLIGHPEYHYDDSAFKAGDAYIRTQKETIHITVAARRDPTQAWRAFGRICHSVQDFYAHSNYVALWQEKLGAGQTTLPEQIDPLDPDILSHPGLRSGRVYYPLEALTYFPWMTGLVRRWLPKDSHAWMNLDSPASGDQFHYALVAARRRTRHEFDALNEALLQKMGASAVRFFSGAGP